MKMTKKTKKHLDILASFSKMLQLKLNSIFSKCKRFFSCYIYNTPSNIPAYCCFNNYGFEIPDTNLGLNILTNNLNMHE